MILEAWGTTKEECLSRLATGLVAGFAAPLPEAPAPLEEPFTLEVGDDPSLEETVVAFLEEVLFLVETEDRVPVRTEVDSLEPGRVEGRYYLLSVEEVEEVGAVPKAVSYEDLIFARAGDGLWHARAIVDV